MRLAWVHWHLRRQPCFLCCLLPSQQGCNTLPRSIHSALSTVHCSSHSCVRVHSMPPRSAAHAYGCCMFRLRSHGSSLFSSGVVRTHGMTFHCMPLLCDSQVFLSSLVHLCSPRNAAIGSIAALHMSRINRYCHHVNFDHAHLSALLGA